jgi:CheY-like chemotaxis protein
MTAIDLVLVAEDNPDDALLLRRALSKAGITARLKIVADGEEMQQYLEGGGEYSNRANFPLPSLIILDLKMPRKSGLEVLRWLGEQSHLAVVPTIVLSASNLEQDIRSAYDLGANTYFVKPSTFDELVDTMTTLEFYWRKAMKVKPGELGRSMNDSASAAIKSLP